MTTDAYTRHKVTAQSTWKKSHARIVEAGGAAAAVWSICCAAARAVSAGRGRAVRAALCQRGADIDQARRPPAFLRAHRRGKLILTEACPRTGSAWTSTGTPHEPRGLKHRPDGAVRAVPIPPILAGLLRQHLREFGTAPDGRLFRDARCGILSESTYWRVWHAARETALGPELAATPLARRPYDLRHAALSLWLSVTSAPAEAAARAGNSIHVLQDVYAHCIDGGATSSASRSKTPSTQTPASHVAHNA